MRLLELRKKYNYTQTQIANLLNTTQGNYGKYEREDAKIDLDSLCKLADLYQTSLDYLCNHETQNLIDTSNWTDGRKATFKIFEQLNERNIGILLGYVTHMLFEQNKTI